MNRVVVTGIGAVTPIGNDAQTTWKGMKSGKNGIGFITRFDTEEFKVKVAAEVKDFDMVINVNLKGAFNMIKHTYSHFMKKRRGRIISISSIVGLNGNAGQANYSSSKAGLIGLTKSTAKELGGRNITVNAIAPGFIDTDMTQQLSDKVKDAMKAQIPMKRPGTPEDIANLALFLASDEASYITGEVIRVDGGYAM